jgi:hypothetical protein
MPTTSRAFAPSTGAGRSHRSPQQPVIFTQRGIKLPRRETLLPSGAMAVKP